MSWWADSCWGYLHGTYVILNSFSTFLLTVSRRWYRLVRAKMRLELKTRLSAKSGFPPRLRVPGKGLEWITWPGRDTASSQKLGSVSHLWPPKNTFQSRQPPQQRAFSLVRVSGPVEHVMTQNSRLESPLLGKVVNSDDAATCSCFFYVCPCLCNFYPIQSRASSRRSQT